MMPPPLPDWAVQALAAWGHQPARHHRLILNELAALADGANDRLMILMPPGSAKSTYASIIFPAWWLSRFPASSIIAVCHTADLAGYFGRQARALLEEHGKLLGVSLARNSRAAGNWSTTEGGEYFAAGVRGPITGRRADLVLIDDPIKSHAEADSLTHRDHVWNWYRGDLAPRLKPGGRIVLVMTRWHDDDLGGRLLASADSWRQLRLPALAEANDPMHRPPGEPLWPEWEDAAALDRKRATVGPRVWSALYQQSPRQDSDALFRTVRIGTIEAEPAELRVARAWDLAATEVGQGRDPDWTVGLKLGRDSSGRFFVLDIVRLRGGPLDVEEAIINTAHQDGRNVVVGLPQDPGQAGKQQVAWLTARLAGYRVVASTETGAKLTRALPVAAQVDAGNVHLVKAAWNQAFLDELRDFPLGRKDDQIDALARAFGLLLDPAAPARRLHLPLLAR